MTPFKLNILLRTPTAVQSDCTLDALLAAALYRLTGSPDRAHSEIPLQCTDGVWHGSRVHHGNGERNQSIFVNRLSVRDLVPVQYKVLKGRSGKETKGPIRIKTISNAYSPRLNILETHVGELSFYGCGNIEQVRYLLMELPGIGKGIRQGHGRIAAIDFEGLDKDLSIVDANGKPARRVPVEIWRALGNDVEGCALEETTWKPAYWNKENMALCVVQ